MADIHHVVEVSAPPSAVFEAVSTPEGLAQWWAAGGGRGDPEPGGSGLSFGPADREWRWQPKQRDGSVFEMTCVQDPGGEETEWMGTSLRFEVRAADDGAKILFQHRDWAAETDFFGHCNFVWSRFLRQLKRQAEAGDFAAGEPGDGAVGG
jgi:uncharacterized protein YndB with AHSA1/START domain